ANHNDWRIQTGFTAVDQAINPVLSETPPDIVISSVAIFAWIWLAGMAAMLCYSLVSLMRLRHSLTGAVRLCGRVYLADHITSPFVAGIFRTKIYLPSGLSEQEQPYILLHEQAHIRRFDPLFRAMAFLALSVHW